MGSVTLRRKNLITGRQSLYLDYYPPLLNSKTGKAQRSVTLKLYLFTKPENELQRIHNKETLLTAQTVCAQRQIEIQNRRFGIISEQDRNASFTEIFRQVSKSRRKSMNDPLGNGTALFYPFRSN